MCLLTYSKAVCKRSPLFARDVALAHKACMIMKASRHSWGTWLPPSWAFQLLMRGSHGPSMAIYWPSCRDTSILPGLMLHNAN